MSSSESVPPVVSVITTPCMKPVVCDMGEGMKAMSRPPIASASASEPSPNRIVLCVWTAPFGRDSVPDVNKTATGSSALMALDVTRGSYVTASSKETPTSCCPRPTRTTVIRSMSFGVEGSQRAGEIGAAKPARDEQRSALALAENKREVRASVSRRHRIDDSANLHDGEKDDDGVPPVGKTYGHDIALADAAADQKAGKPIRAVVEIAIGQACARRVDDGHLVWCRAHRLLEKIGDRPNFPVPCIAIESCPVWIRLRKAHHDLLPVSAGLQYGVEWSRADRRRRGYSVRSCSPHTATAGRPPRPRSRVPGRRCDASRRAPPWLPSPEDRHKLAQSSLCGTGLEKRR